MGDCLLKLEGALDAASEALNRKSPDHNHSAPQARETWKPREGDSPSKNHVPVQEGSQEQWADQARCHLELIRLTRTGDGPLGRVKGRPNR